VRRESRSRKDYKKNPQWERIYILRYWVAPASADSMTSR
jgi:hypothetical protein